MDSYDIRFWDIKKLGNGTAARYRVRWAVNGRERCRSFKARPLADGFLAELKDAVSSRRPFDPRTGLPEAEVTEDEVVTWYARAYAEAKWANLAPVSRRSVAEALVTVTIALSKKEPGAPDPKVLRQALFAWAFNPATRDIAPPPHIAAALDWAERASLAVTYLEDTANVRLALAACATTLAGKPTAGSTQRRKRSVFYNALGYAVELAARAIAAQLAEAGYVVYLGSRDAGRGRRAAEELGADRRDVRFLALDVTDQASVDAAAAVIGEESGHLDVLVNNAGIFVQGPPPVGNHRRGHGPHLRHQRVRRRPRHERDAPAAAQVPRCAHRQRRQRSRLATQPRRGGNPAGEFPVLLAYNSSKSALNAVTIAYAKELAVAGIKVNVAAPGYVATDLNGHAGMISPEQGARIPVRMATLPAEGPTGAFAAAGENGETINLAR